MLLEQTQRTHARGHALPASGRAQVTVQGGRLAFADHGVFAAPARRNPIAGAGIREVRRVPAATPGTPAAPR